MVTSKTAEPILDLVQFAHIELLSPDLEGSLGFFKSLLGLEETARDGRSVYLRCYEEGYHHTLKLTEAAHAGLGHVAFRCRSPQALERRVKAIEASGQGRGWIDGDLGHGRAYQFDTPAGHRWEIFFDVDYYAAPDGLRSSLKNRPSRRPASGIPARRLDHFNITAPDAGAVRDFLCGALGFMEREKVVVDDKPDITIASWLSVTNLSHDLAVVPEGGKAGRLHHLCLHAGSNEALFDAADLCRESGIRVEHGPGRHGIGKTTFLYMIEPGGNRIELIGDTGALIFDPTFPTVVWKASELATAAVWTGSEFPQSFWSYATPDEALTMLDAAIAG
jgi:catechol 2,3-dioxygenase